ncbi:hypothetical protein ACHAQE_011092 [Botrytis cinerea]
MDTHEQESSSQFRYNQVNESKREIRLIQVAFDPKGKSPCGTIDKLQLRLVHRSLDDPASFSALSYCWNPNKSSSRSSGQKIKINNGDICIGNNLHDFLLQLHHDRFDGWLWVDAICINQSDAAEKNWQLLQMRSIYSDAKTIFMWLGVGTTDTSQAMDFISQAGPEALESRVSSLGDKDKPFNTNFFKASIGIAKICGNSEYELCEGEDDTAKTFRAILRMRDTAELWMKSPLTEGLHHILTNPYWTRIWIIQEVVLAKSAMVMIGDRTVSLQQLEAVFAAIKYNWKLDIKDKLSSSPLDHRLFSIRSLEIRRGLLGPYIPLKSILWQTCPSPGRPHYEATYPRDIVLGLMGILSAEEIELLSVECETSEVDTFISITRHLFCHKTPDGRRSGHDFDLSCCPLKFTSNDCAAWKKGLPSWVPDWVEIGLHGVQSNGVNYWNYSRPCDRILRSGVSWTKQPAYDHHDRISDNHVLRCLGCRVGIIVKANEDEYEPVVDDYEQTSGFSEPELNAAGDFYNRIIPSGEYEPLSQFTFDDESKNRAVEEFEGLIDRREGRKQSSGMPTDWLPEGLQKIMVNMLREETREQVLLEECFAAIRNELPDSNEAIATKEKGLAKKAWGRTLASSRIQRTSFKVENGMTGIGDPAIRPGDVVILLWETRSPVVLRERQEGGWIFCGDSYVDGIMDGEFMETAWTEEEFSVF